MLILSSLTLVGCSSANFEYIYDNNATIAKGSDRYFGKNVKQSKTNDGYQFSASEYTGVIKIKSINIDADSKFDIKTSISSGDFKIVLVKSDDVLTIVEGANQSIVNIAQEAGKYDLKIVGRQADVKLSIKYINIG